MNWYLEVMRKYAVFEGRARRREYWFFVLLNLIFSIMSGLVDKIAGTYNVELEIGLFGGLYALAVLVPGIAVGVRRMHDTDHRGWWLLVPIANLVFAVTEGTGGENRFGPDPKGTPADGGESSPGDC